MLLYQGDNDVVLVTIPDVTRYWELFGLLQRSYYRQPTKLNIRLRRNYYTNVVRTLSATRLTTSNPTTSAGRIIRLFVNLTRTLLRLKRPLPRLIRLHLGNARRLPSLTKTLLSNGNLRTRLRTIRRDHRNTKTYGIRLVVPLRRLRRANIRRLNMRSFGERRRSTGNHNMKQLRVLFPSVLYLTPRRRLRHVTNVLRHLHVTKNLNVLWIHMNVTKRFKISKRPSHTTIHAQRPSNMFRPLNTTQGNNRVNLMLLQNRSLFRGNPRLSLARGTTNLGTQRRLLRPTRVNNGILRLTRPLMRLFRLIIRNLRTLNRPLLRNVLRLLVRNITSLVRLFYILNLRNNRIFHGNLTRLFRLLNINNLRALRPLNRSLLLTTLTLYRHNTRTLC